jgi:alkanesulfonate monooxygenase SsuD/methylene tetrahydromethanopterin reductase-like flavin-dependent oxidoreductase (luciferase family)
MILAMGSGEQGVGRQIRVGVQLPEVEREVPWSEYAAMARAAEEVGLDSVWVGDHYLYRDGRGERGPWEAWTLLAGLAAVTQRVRLGPLVACLGFRAPAVLAKTAATVDEISGGRLVLGVGAGWNETEFRAFGLPFDHRVSRFEEAFGIVRRLVGGERVTFSGRFHSVEDAVLLPAPQNRTPLMVGGTGPRLLSIALPHCEAWNTWFDWYGNTPEGFAEKSSVIPAGVEKSACVYVELEGGTGWRTNVSGTQPVSGEGLAEHLRELADAGADEAILVVDPIDERSIRTLGETIS